MIRSGTLVLILAFAADSGACASSSNSSKQASGRSEEVKVVDKGLAELQGNWHAAMYVNGYGLCTLTLAMDARGKGYYMAHVKGLPLSGYVQVHSWNGSTLEGTVEGQRRHLRGRIEGNEATFDVPVLGSVTLRRKGKTGDFAGQ